MSKIKLILLTVIFLPIILRAQQKDFKIVYTSDIDHFWQAYDSVANTADSAAQVDIIQRLYVDRGTPGLKAFMAARQYDALLWMKLIHKYPGFWRSIRKNTLSVKDHVPDITKSIDRFKKLYPEMRPAKMYFTVGGLRSGGTTTADMVLIGAEIATADQLTDASELSDWLKNVFKNQRNTNIVSLNVHEYVHTQQKAGDGGSLLSQTIKEGAADFISELVTHKNNNAYMIYGRAHEPELKKRFLIEMFSTAMGNWLYNGSDNPHPDLGYFMGYSICKAYYNRHQANRRKAIKTIMELDYTNEKQLTDFLEASRYYGQPINKEEQLKAFEKLQPYVTGLSPDINGNKNVDTSLSELTINFSEPMAKGYSFSYGDGGKEHFPITGVAGFTDDRRSIKVKLKLEPGKSYNFEITDMSFASLTGYPLKPYTVSFDVK